MKATQTTADEKLAKLESLLAEGRTIYVQTSLRAWKIDARCVARFAKVGAKVLKSANGSLWMASGKRFVCIDLCRITVEG